MPVGNASGWPSSTGLRRCFLFLCLVRYIIPLGLDSKPGRKHVRCARFCKTFCTRHDFSVFGTYTICATQQVPYFVHSIHSSIHPIIPSRITAISIFAVSNPSCSSSFSEANSTRTAQVQVQKSSAGYIIQVCSAWCFELGLPVSTPQPRHAPRSPNFRCPIIRPRVETVVCCQHGYAAQST